MDAFDKVIGYESIKNVLRQISDMIRNREVYTAVGAKLPHGLLIHGDPGLGKTLMAKCLMEACGLPRYTLRRNQDTKEFIAEMRGVFRKAEA